MKATLYQSDILILGFPEYEQQAHALANALDAPLRIVELHHFPDGESLVKLPAALPQRILLIRSLDNPNSKLIELMLCSSTARALGVEHITLIAPYLCYMRQDNAFHPGEAVSQRIIGQFIASLCDSLITVDPHLHRIQHLSEVISVHPAEVVSASALFSHFICEQFDNPLLIGPDSESRQWVSKVAEYAQLDYEIAKKIRHSDSDVSIELPSSGLRDRAVIIIDDIASTGNTLATAARKIVARGANTISALVTHALFTNSAMERLQQAGIRKIWSTDSISHPTNAISLTSALKESVERIIAQ